MPLRPPAEAYLGITGHFVFHSEQELGGGYADVCLALNLASYVDMRHGYVVELKYVKAASGPSGRWTRRWRWRSYGVTWPMK